MDWDFSGKRALLAGTVDELLVGAGQALSDAGAQLITAGDAAMWGGLPRETVTLDAADPEVLGEQIGRLGALDILIISAGWRHHASFVDHSPADWEAALTVNFKIPLFLAQAVARTMIVQRQGGRIVFLSGVESLMPFEGTAASGTSLTMLGALAKMMAVDLAPHHITVNVIAAGWLNGERYSSLTEAAQQHIVNGIPQGRPALPTDIGVAVAFLASDSAGYITGTILPVDGGYTLTRSPGQTMLKP